MFTLSLKSYLTIGIIILIVLFGIYFKYSQVQLDKKTTEIAQLKETIEIQRSQIVTLEESAKQISEIKNKLTDIERANNEASLKLSKALNKLSILAQKKPGLVENIINQASKERLRCLSLVTGAKPDKKETNRVCPQVLERK